MDLLTSEFGDELDMLRKVILGIESVLTVG